MKHLLCLLGATMLLAGATATTALAGDDHPDKVTLCHASGLAGTTKYETLTVGYPAAYGPAGHFDENGTPNAGHEQDYLGECVEQPPPPTDFCPTLPGVQAEDEDCPPPPPVDVCPNLEGTQEDVPPGLGLVNGECVPVGINPQCAPPAVIVEGVCIVPPPPPVNPPNVKGDANVFCDRGAQLYRITGTIDGNTIDTSIPITIPGNTRGFTNITLVRGDTQFRTVVFTYGDCSVAPPVITATPAAVTTPAAPVTPAKPAAPAKPAKPAAKPKPKPKPAPKAKPKPKPKVVVTHKPGPHVCVALKDGTKRHWWKGGNGMPAGCYPIIKGSG